MVWLLAGSVALNAQSARPAGVTVKRTADSLGKQSSGGEVFRIRESSSLRPYAPLVSAVLPGGGQLILGENRFIAYAAVELFGWWQYRKNIHERSRQEAAYKALARSVARSHFSANPPDADWAYYEQMRDFKESGVYSRTPGGRVVPESDPSTYNGFKWRLALATHSNDSAAALVEYETVAIKPEFRWSWFNAELQYDIFKLTTNSRNDANHAATTNLMIIGANHVLSMVDAFVTFRLRVQPQPNGRTGLGARIPW